MSFGSGSTGRVPNRKPKALGVDEDRFSTNEQAKPVPLFAGKLRIACQFISDVFDVDRHSVSTGGKQKVKTGTSYFASFAALIGHGPVDGIHAVILNGDQVWPDPESTDSLVRDVDNPDFVNLTIEDYGLIDFKWGTETQVADDYLRRKSGITHPPYRGFSYMVAHQLFLGFNQNNIQNLELIVSRYPELGASPANINGDANPANVLYELLTNPRIGKGFDVSRIDTDAMESLGVRLAAEQIGISPLINSQKDAISWIVQLLEYFDGYPIIDAATGILYFDAVRPRLPAGLPEIDETILMEPPQMAPEDWSATFSETNVKFTSPAQKYDPDAKTWRDRGSFQISGELNTQTLERPWITNSFLADFQAKAIGRVSAIPEVTGTLSLRLTAALFAQLEPGAGFLLTYPPRGYSQVQCIVTERSVADPARPLYQVAFRVDRSYLLADLEVDGVGEGGGEELVPVEQIEHMRLIQLPDDLSPEPERIHVAVLCSRPEALTAGFIFHLGQNYDFSGVIAAESYDSIATHDRFAWRGELLEDYASGGPATDDIIGLALRLTGSDVELPEATEFDGLTDDLLVFIADEIFNVFQATLTGVDEYRLFVKRERFGTAQGSYLAGDEAFIVRRSDLLGIRHAIMEPGNTVVAKIQAFTGMGQAPLDEQTEIDLAIV